MIFSFSKREKWT